MASQEVQGLPDVISKFLLPVLPHLFCSAHITAQCHATINNHTTSFSNVSAFR